MPDDPALRDALACDEYQLVSVHDERREARVESLPCRSMRLGVQAPAATMTLSASCLVPSAHSTPMQVSPEEEMIGLTIVPALDEGEESSISVEDLTMQLRARCPPSPPERHRDVETNQLLCNRLDGILGVHPATSKANSQSWTFAGAIRKEQTDLAGVQIPCQPSILAPTSCGTLCSISALDESQEMSSPRALPDSYARRRLVSRSGSYAPVN